MQVALIPPVPLLKKYGTLTDYHLCLAHLAETSEKYRQFYMDRSANADYVMMDNSVIELGTAVSLERIIAAARSVGACEIILPDVLFESLPTLELARAGVEEARELGWTGRIQAAVQGKSLMEAMSCFECMLDIEGLDVIGIPRSLNEMVNGNRSVILHTINKTMPGDDRFGSHQYHLLGLSDNVTELRDVAHLDWIRGVDSKLPIRAGLNLVAFDEDRGLLINKSGIPSLNMYHHTDPQPVFVYHNVNVTLKMAEAPQPGEVIQWPKM